MEENKNLYKNSYFDVNLYKVMIIDLVKLINEERFLKRIYLSMRDYQKEKSD